VADEQSATLVVGRRARIDQPEQAEHEQPGCGHRRGGSREPNRGEQGEDHAYADDGPGLLLGVMVGQHDEGRDDRRRQQAPPQPPAVAVRGADPAAHDQPHHQSEPGGHEGHGLAEQRGLP
jgi:hypothetical protein